MLEVLDIDGGGMHDFANSGSDPEPCPQRRHLLCANTVPDWTSMPGGDSRLRWAQGRLVLRLTSKDGPATAGKQKGEVSKTG